MNVVFDLGGVLFDWRPHEIVARVLPQHAPTAEAVQRLVDDIFQGYGGDWSEFDRGTIAPEPLALAIAKRTGMSVADVRAVIDAVPHALAPIPGTVNLLERLHPRLLARGRALYFLSNMPEPYAQHLEATHGFLSLFKRGVFSARVQLTKPEPAIYARAAELLGITPAQSLFIDDMDRNVHAARAAGWEAVLFENPAQCERELQARGLL